LNSSRLAPVFGAASLAVVALFATTARAAPCVPVRIEHPDAMLPLEWSRALNELMEATSVEGQAWSCTGGALTLSVDASGRFATLTLTDASGQRVERRIPRAEDLVPSAKALLAAPPAEIAPAPAPAPPPVEVEAGRTEPPPKGAAAITPEPRFMVDALLGTRYRNPEKAIWGAATVRAMIPFGAWSGGFWLRGAVPTSLEGHGEKYNRTTSEATLGVSGGRRLIKGPFELHLTIDPSITFAFEPSATNVPPDQPGKHDELVVKIKPQLGLGLRGTFPIAGPIRGSVALDGEFLPETIGAGLSLGIQAVIR
jgi:hypothetical protein